MRPRLFLCFVAALITFGLIAPAAFAAGHAYTPQNPAYNVTLNNGYGTSQLDTQVNFSGPTFQWSLQLNPSSYNVAIGPMTEDADLYCNGSRITGYHDHHGPVSPGYLIHSSYKGLKTSCNYQLAVNESFPIEKNGKTGTRYIYTRFDFYISYA